MSFPIGFATGAGVPTTEEMDAAAAFGAKFIRCGLPWDSGSVAPDSNFNRTTAITTAIAYANSIGLGVVLQIGAGPTYGGMMCTHSGPGGFDVLTEFAGFCANVARAFTGTNPADPDYVWSVEIGNEANHGKWNAPFLDDDVTPNPYFIHWTGSAPTGPQRYAELFLRVVHSDWEDVRATPGCPQIITTGLGGESDSKGINSYDFTVAVHQTLSFGGHTYTGGLWPNGGDPWYDGFDLHPYCYPTLPTADTTGGWANMESIMAWFQANRGTKPPLWITEFGHPTNPETLATCLAARDSMANAVSDLNTKVASGWDVRGFAWFSIMNNNKVGGGNDNFFGIVDRPASGTDPQNGAHKPSAALGGTGQLWAKFVELATADDIIVPNTIPTSAPGAPLTRDVSDDLQAFFDAIPLNTGGRVLFQPNRVYHVEGTIGLDGNKNLTIDGRGATIRAVVTKFYSGVVGPGGIVNGLTVGPPYWTIGSQQVKTVTGPPGTFSPNIMHLSILAWYVDAPDCRARTQGARSVSGQPDIPAATSSVVHILADPSDMPPDSTNKTLTFTSPDDRNRCQFIVNNCTNLKVTRLNIWGANQTWAAFKNELEQQTGLWIQGGCDGYEISNNEIHHNWGDCVTIAPGAHPLNLNGWVHHNELHHSTRQTMTTQGCIDLLIEDNNMHDGHRHIIDMEPNGGNQTCQRVTYRNNQMLRGNFGCLAISAYGYLPMFVGDIVFDRNTIEGELTLPVGTNHNRPSTQPRWGPFTITNNTATVPLGTGALPGSWISGHAYTVGQQVTDFSTTPDSFWQCKVNVTSATRPGADPTHWQKISIWGNAPAVIKFQYCDGITVKNNVIPMADGRTMYAVWADHCTGVDVNGNHDKTPTDPFVSPHFELFTDQMAGTGTFQGGGTFSATGVSVPSTKGSAQFEGGGLFSATGVGKNYATAVTFSGGGVFAALGHGVAYGTATFDGGGDFTAVGRSQNFGAAQFDGGGDFTATGRGVNFGQADFSGGGGFTAIGQSNTSGTATFEGGGTFTAIGVGQNFGRGSFAGGGTFSAAGSTTTGDYQDGDWCVGAVKLRGPGWDDDPWDTTPWDGKE